MVSSVPEMMSLVASGCLQIEFKVDAKDRQYQTEWKRYGVDSFGKLPPYGGSLTLYALWQAISDFSSLTLKTGSNGDSV